MPQGNPQDPQHTQNLQDPQGLQHAQDVKAIAQRILIEVIDGKDFDLADQLIAEDVLDHTGSSSSSSGSRSSSVSGSSGGGSDGGPSDGSGGRRAWKEWVQTVHRAFPDWRHVIEDFIVDGDRVAVRQVVLGTHRGAFRGIPPTGKQVRQPGIDIMRIRDGKLVEHWGQYDWLGLFAQLGALTPPGQSSAPEAS